MKPKYLSLILDELLGERAIDHQTQLQYKRSLRCFGLFLGAPPTTADLVETKINAWLASLTEISATTVHNRKRGMTAIWNYAAGRNFVRYYDTRRLRKTKPTPPIVVARSVSEVRVLLSACEGLEGNLQCGVSASSMMTARVLIGFETGLRSGDILRLRFDQIDGNSINIIQNKVKRPHSTRISDLTLQAIDAIRSPSRIRLFPLGKGGLRHWEDRLYAIAATLGVHKRRREALGALRKTFATEITLRDGIETAARGLGHSTSTGTSVAKIHYVPSDALSKPIEPPRVHSYGRATTTRPRCKRRA